MKVVLLAGGFGTRMAEYTETIPKPMVEVGDRPILWHLMNVYAHHGFKDFGVALGYKGQVIKDYFARFHNAHADFTVDLGSGKLEHHERQKSYDWRITLVDTGLNSMTGGRVRRMRSYIDGQRFMLSYGDGLADVDLKKLLAFHKKHGKMVTVTAVHPPARFGELDLQGDQVVTFKEKPQTSEGWINGGFFVMEPGFLDMIEADETILEREPLERVAAMGELVAYKHHGFWKCMDTARDRNTLEELWKNGTAPWKRYKGKHA